MNKPDLRRRKGKMNDMKRMILLALLLAGGCATTPPWWRPAKGNDTVVLDDYLWQIHATASPSRGTYALLANYSPEQAGPAISAVLGHEQYASCRHEIIRAVSDFYEARNTPPPAAMLSIFNMGAQDADPDVRRFSQQCLSKVKQQDN